MGIVSSRRGCNQALFDTPNIKDYDIVWIEDYLDRLIIPLSKTKLARMNEPGDVSPFTVAKVIRDMIKKFGDEKGVSWHHVTKKFDPVVS